MVALQPLQRLAHRRAADAELGAELGLRPDAARRQLQRDDHLFQARARLLGEPRPGAAVQASGLAARARVDAGALAGGLAPPSRADSGCYLSCHG